jgi:hypothetical protein
MGDSPHLDVTLRLRGDEAAECKPLAAGRDGIFIARLVGLPIALLRGAQGSRGLEPLQLLPRQLLLQLDRFAQLVVPRLGRKSLH